ncbi:hypothetical protein [uncultured Megasphaera sp.]|uniref:hypothetical protein n=1 Tax=uncultured Megasphaera sp. TaxID=165188 RepID=UPI0025914BC7|nr:hypothetical protein [uncultured Megasphaera sp.]
MSNDKELLINNFFRVPRKMLRKKYPDMKFCGWYNHKKKCRPGLCEDYKEGYCDECLSAHDIASISFIYYSHMKNINRHNKHKLRTKMMLKAFEQIHLSMSRYCIKCKVKDALCCFIQDGEAFVNKHCIHPLREMQSFSCRRTF